MLRRTRLSRSLSIDNTGSLWKLFHMDNIDNNVIDNWYCLWQLCQIVTLILIIVIFKILTLILVTLLWGMLYLQHCLYVDENLDIDIDQNENIVIVNLTQSQSSSTFWTATRLLPFSSRTAKVASHLILNYFAPNNVLIQC